MLDKKWLMNNLEEAKSKLATRGFDLDIEKLKALDCGRKELQKSVDDMRSQEKKAKLSYYNFRKCIKDAEDLDIALNNTLEKINEYEELANSLMTIVDEGMDTYAKILNALNNISKEATHDN